LTSFVLLTSALHTVATALQECIHTVITDRAKLRTVSSAMTTWPRAERIEQRAEEKLTPWVTSRPLVPKTENVTSSTAKKDSNRHTNRIRCVYPLINETATRLLDWDSYSCRTHFQSRMPTCLWLWEALLQPRLSVRRSHLCRLTVWSYASSGSTHNMRGQKNATIRTTATWP